MRKPVRTASVRPAKGESPVPSGSWRDRLAMLIALVTVLSVGSAFFLSRNTQFLMPGPLASAHSAIENCDVCHSKSGSGKLSWAHRLVAGDPLDDSKACLTCHKMPDTALNPHSASPEMLEQSTARLTRIASKIPAPHAARAQSVAFPADAIIARDLYCATCHQEHKGANFSLNKISNEQCQSCHVVKFDSFDGHHPQFENYPFNRRTPIIYDHAGHFEKHFPEMAQKDPAKRIPVTCSTCHNSSQDRRVMAVAPFEQTCSACHLDQITGKERASGPKGIAFLSLPGLDLQTLKKKNASIGEWPEDSDAALTPFMKVMISRTERGRTLINAVEGLSLQDLSSASDAQVKAVTDLVWEIKGLFYALIKGKASDVLADLNITGGKAKLSADLVADLTASIPRDVVIGAQEQWLPNLAAEMANGPAAASKVPQAEEAADRADTARAQPDNAQEALSAENSGSVVVTESADESEKLDEPSVSNTGPADPEPAPESEGSEAATRPKRNPQACLLAVFGQCLVTKESEKAPAPEGAAIRTNSVTPRPYASTGKFLAEELPPPMRAGLKQIAQAQSRILPAGEPPQNKAADQTDDLLFPTEEELRAMKKAGRRDAGNAAQPEGVSGKTNASNAKPTVAAPSTGADAPVISIESTVDPESWAEYGGWYRQDYTIYYRPTGHKDKFIYSWLFLTGPQAPKGDKSPAAAVFDYLASKDAQGSCTKCHSVDDIPGKGRAVNFSPPSIESKQGRFTKFVHEPHFGALNNKNDGCLTCHNLEKGRPYLKSYEQGDPQTFVSNFGAVKKELCQTCHTSSMARQDCLLCHKYHVNDVITPLIDTKIPSP